MSLQKADEINKEDESIVKDVVKPKSVAESIENIQTRADTPDVTIIEDSNRARIVINPIAESHSKTDSYVADLVNVGKSVTNQIIAAKPSKNVQNVDHSIKEDKAYSKKNTILQNKELLPFEKNHQTVSLGKYENLKRRHLLFSPKKRTPLEISSSAPVDVQNER